MIISDDRKYAFVYQGRYIWFNYINNGSINVLEASRLVPDLEGNEAGSSMIRGSCFAEAVAAINASVLSFSSIVQVEQKGWTEVPY